MHPRRGDQEAALSLWRHAADIAIAEMVPLLAVCIGLDCGGEEGERLINAACEAVHRPRGTLLGELSEARCDQKIKFAAGDRIHDEKRFTVGPEAELNPLPVQLQPHASSERPEALLRSR